MITAFFQPFRNRRGRRGVTLIELMVTTVILSLGILAGIASFKYIAVSIQLSKIRTLANNLAQERVEFLKNKTYYNLLVTTATYSDTRLTPALSYAIVGYPAETLNEGGIVFTRATRVDFAFQNGSTISTTSWSNADTGLKQITIYVIWQDPRGNYGYIELKNLMTSTVANPQNAIFSGDVTQRPPVTCVRFCSNSPIEGALVQVIENPEWFAFTDASGEYSFSVSPGSYTLTASYPGDFPGSSYQAIGSGQVKVVDFNLTPMILAGAQTNVYLQDHLVISQVVASTGAADAKEYIELYNPTTSYVQIGAGSGFHMFPNGYLLGVDTSSGTSWLYLTIVSTQVPPNGFYLISNTPTLDVMGTTLTADAYYAAGVSTDSIRTLTSTGIRMYRYNGSYSLIDSMGWRATSGGTWPPTFETLPYSPSAGSTLSPGHQIVRFSTPAVVNMSYGPSYDSNDSSHDFTHYTVLTVPPKTTATTQTPLSGTPATGAFVSLNDFYSTPGQCVDTTLSGGHRVCSFGVGASTGIWTAIISSQAYYVQIDSFTVAWSGFGATPVYSFPSMTTSPPAPIISSIGDTLLRNTTNYAFISGYVRDPSGTGVSNISVAANGRTGLTGTNGRYFLGTPEGTFQILANPNNANPVYSSEALTVTTVAGSLYDNQDFVISPAGSVRGYIRNASNTALPNRPVVVLRGSSQIGQTSTDSSGYFYINNIATGSYTVQTALDPAESASPSTINTTLTVAGTTVFVGTFTVSNSLSQIVGQVLSGSSLIRTGALVLASTSTLSGGASSPPPSISGTTGPLCAPCYYGGSSDSMGTYSIDVRSSTTTYKVYGWYGTVSGTTASYTRVGPYTVGVSTGGVQVNQDLTW